MMRQTLFMVLLGMFVNIPLGCFAGESCDPVSRVLAEEIKDNNVVLSWDRDLIEGFESGDFSAFSWVNNSTYPWVITTNAPYDGAYCMKSGNALMNSSSSSIQVSVEVVGDGSMSFYHKISSESNYDKGFFYIDGTQKMNTSGDANWQRVEYPVTAGVHTFKWEYNKDTSVNQYDDCWYIDNVIFTNAQEPMPEGSAYFDFEDGLQGWTNIDADGDGNTWGMITEMYSGTAGHDSNDGVASQSYTNNTALNPDNYLVTPRLPLGGTFSFYAAAYNASFTAEHFGVAVSTISQSNPADFAMLNEWTMTAKGMPQGGSRDRVDRVGNWYQYTVDLSAYEGQMGYIAIRHFDCTDQWALLVDDVDYRVLGNSSQGQWFYYDDGTPATSVGEGDTHLPLYWGIMVPASNLNLYNGFSLTRVAFFETDATGTATINIYQGGSNAPGTLIHTQDVEYTGALDWHYVDLTANVPVDVNQNLWITMYNNGDMEYPAVCSENTGDPNGRWISEDGTNWMDVAGTGINNTWMVRGYLSGSTLPTGSYTINVSANPTNGGTAIVIKTNNNSGSFQPGEQCKVKATPATGYEFTNWMENNSVVPYAGATYTFQVYKNRELKAIFNAVTYYTINVSASPSYGGTAIVTKTNNISGSFQSGEQCTVKATPKEGYRFVNWTKNGEDVNYSNPYSFKVTEGGTYVANFTKKKYTIQAKAEPSEGGSVDGAGSFDHGAQCTLTATPKEGYRFVYWSKDGQQVAEQNPYSFQVTDGGIYVAHFTNKYTISVSAGLGGAATVGPNNSNSYIFEYGQSCTVKATPAAGYEFVNWKDGNSVVFNGEIYTFQVHNDRNLKAYFSPQKYDVTLHTDGGTINSGNVTSYTYGVGATLPTNVTKTGYTFGGWYAYQNLSGSPVTSISSTATGKKEYWAKWDPESQSNYTITIISNPSAGGIVSGGGTYSPGATCTVTAIPNVGYSFANWVENYEVVSTDNPYVFEVRKNRVLHANFNTSSSYYISASAGANGSITPQGDIEVSAGGSQTFSIAPNFGCRISSVFIDGTDLGAIETYTFSNVNANHTIIALFSGWGVEEDSSTQVDMFPNPAKDYVVVEGSDVAEIQFYNMLGEKVLDVNGNSDVITVSTGNLPSGTYVVVITLQNGERCFGKVVITD